MVGIYKIISPSGKVYIGQSWDMETRVYAYRNAYCKAQKKLYSSLIKYGWGAHIFEIIHELPEDVTQEVMDNYEILYWQLYKDSNTKLLNLREPGSRGKHSQETIEKMKGKIISVERRNKISNSLMGHTVSNETREKLSKKIKELYSNEEYKKTIKWTGVINKGNTRGKKYPKKNRPSKEELEFILTNSTLREVSVIYNVSEPTIRNWISDYNIDYRRKHRLIKRNTIQ